MSDFDLDVAIIGSGPSGIAAATALSEAGVKNIVVYEREAEVGGIPRHTPPPQLWPVGIQTSDVWSEIHFHHARPVPKSPL